MDDKPRYPWRLATNERYRDVINHLMTLSTASLLLPSFLAKEFLSVNKEVALRQVVGWPIYGSWIFLSLAIFSGIAFHFLSAKWVRLAWGQDTDIWKIPVTDSFVELALHLCFWLTTLSFLLGLGFSVAFLFGYGAPVLVG